MNPSTRRGDRPWTRTAQAGPHVAAPARPPTSRLDRGSGGCLVAAGVLLLPGILHPDIFDTSLADAALSTPLWVPMHAAAVAAAVLTLVALAGVYGARAGRLGRLGAVGFVLAVPGLVMTAAVAYAEAFLLPVIARTDPEVFAWDGPVTTSWPVRLSTGLAILWLVGLLLIALALWRSEAIPAAPALTLAAATAVWPVLGGLLIPVLSSISTLAVAAGYAWVGVALVDGAVRRGGHDEPA